MKKKKNKRWMYPTSFYVPTVIDVGAPPWYLSGGVAAANCIAAYKAIGAASQAASYINLANPGTYNCTATVAPTWSAAAGWIGDGTQYLKTGLSPTNDQTWSAIVRCSDITGTNGRAFGTQRTTGGNRWFFICPNRSDATVGYFSGSYLTVAPAATSGVFGFAGNIAYRNGIAETGTLLNAAGDLPEIYIIGSNNDPALGSGLVGYVQAFSIYDTTLTPAQVLAVSTAMAALT